MVVGGEPRKLAKVVSAALPITSREDFLRSVDENGAFVFERLSEFAETRSLLVHWGTKGFSLNVDLQGNHVAICYGYNPTAVFRQSVYTAF